jgi:ethanolamine ammonia-lyase small subunit
VNPNDARDGSLSSSDRRGLLQRIRARTPARLLVGHVGAAYRTSTQLELREAHAAARDAVSAELDLAAFDAAFLRQWDLFEVATQADSKEEYLLRPDLGRRFNSSSRTELTRRCSRQQDLQIAVGDGLSVTAVSAQVPPLLTALDRGAKARGWTIGRVFVVRHCRVGILNEIGEILEPQVAVLLIGERPGLATAESLSAYMAYRPQKAHSDANRNLISNIHRRGVRPEDAAARILNLAEQMMKQKTSGHQLREQLPPRSDARLTGRPRQHE